MPTQATNKIISDIIDYFNNEIPSDLYIWITNDINRRLFWEHNVDDTNKWLYAEALNSEHSRYIEKYFLDLWLQWAGWWWNYTAKFVYCYKIWPYTVE